MICSVSTKATKSLCSTYKNYKNHVKDGLCPTEKQYAHLSQDCAAWRSMHSDFIFVSERCHIGGNLFAVGGGVQSMCNYMETVVDMVQCFL